MSQEKVEVVRRLAGAAAARRELLGHELPEPHQRGQPLGLARATTQSGSGGRCSPHAGRCQQACKPARLQGLLAAGALLV